MDQSEPGYWDQQAKIPKMPELPPEVPQLPDVAFEVTCKSCSHSLDRHNLGEMKFITSEDGHTRLAYRWNCGGHDTSQSGTPGVSMLGCPCVVFQPAERHIRNFREGPPI